MSDFDAVVVGSGPNGLAAAVHLSNNGMRVLVVEAAETIGGGTRTEDLTLPGFHHDVCSTIHPLGVASPFFTSHGFGDWIHPEIPVTHPLGDGRVGTIHRSLEDTVAGFGSDGERYRSTIGHLVEGSEGLIEQVLSPVGIPSNPLTMGRFALSGVTSASQLARPYETAEARGVIAGLAAHAVSPLTTPLTGAVALLFAATAHASGWPAVRSGSGRLADQMAEFVTDHGGEIETGRRIGSLSELPPARVAMLDVMPPAAERIVGGRLSSSAKRRLRAWKAGPGVFKVDWALDGPVPWLDDMSGRAGTVHVGGTFEEVAAAEAQVAEGEHPDAPFVLVAQTSVFDTSRAPDGAQTLWAYCHVPSGSSFDMTDRIERQIERFAPGFRDRIVATHTLDPSGFERHNANYVGGDIAGGAFSPRKIFQIGGRRPYRLGDGVYLCSSATPPGAGVHGMCGYHAARAALADL